MPTNDLQPVRFDALDEPAVAEQVNWLWNGYLKPGDITLLTSQWKTGKTTLLAGVLRSLGTGTPFLGRDTRPARVWVVSEESRSQWAERTRLMPWRIRAEAVDPPRSRGHNVGVGPPPVIRFPQSYLGRFPHVRCFLRAVGGETLLRRVPA